MLSKPLGIFIDTDDDNTLYVADNGNRRVIKFNQDSFKGKSLLQDKIFLDYVNLDDEQNLYVNNYSKILKFTPDSVVGITVAGADEPGKELNQLNNVSGFILDKEKNLYISDGSNRRVVMWKPNAKSGILLADDTDQNTNDSVKLVHPSGIYVNSSNNSLYISDQRDNLIYRFPFHPTESLTNEIVAGNGERGGSLHHLNGPTTIIVVNNKDIYVSDVGNNRIVRWTVGSYEAGGTCIVGCSGRSGNSTNMLKQPQDFKFDSKGNLIVSDTGNNRIQKFELIHNEC
jgi:sugar lactone lactonase YvrE